MSRERDAMWAPWRGAGLEHLALACDEEGVRADGVVIGVEGDLRFRIRYEVSCDARWRVHPYQAPSRASQASVVRRTRLGDDPFKWHEIPQLCLFLGAHHL